MSERTMRERLMALGECLPENWPIWVIAAACGMFVWNGWIRLGEMCGIGSEHPLPGLWPGLSVNVVLVLPITTEAYGAYALAAGIRRRGSTPESIAARRFGQWSAGVAIAMGIACQVISHVLTAEGVIRAPLPAVGFVASLPVIILGFSLPLGHLLHSAKVAEAKADAERVRQEDAELERERRGAETERLRIEAQDREAQRRHDDRERQRQGRERRHELLAEERHEGERHDGTVSRQGASGVTPTGPYPVVQPPPEARANTPERRAMWSAWVHIIRTERRTPSGAELLTAGRCNPSSSLGRQMAAKWARIEPAASLQRERRAGGDEAVSSL